MQLALRPASATDAEYVARIYVSSWNAGFGLRMPRIEADAARTERWRRTLATARLPERWWVAERGGECVGFAGVCPSRDPVDPQLGEIDTIAVEPAAWRSGVGRALLEAAVRALADHGYAQAILWTLADYPLGERFYRAAGFLPNGRIRREGSQRQYARALSAGSDQEWVRPPSREAKDGPSGA